MLALVCATMIFLLVLTRRGVHEIRRKEEQARHLATHDVLTGLPNRVEAVAVINSAIFGRERGTQVAAIVVDIDGFRDIDDSYGHETGDCLLLEIAAVFRECAGKHFLAKVGGDEFVLVVTDHQATKIACDIGWRMIESLAEPFDIGGRIIPVAVNIGIAVADTIDPSADELLRRADVAMIQAKHQGSRRFVLYEPVIDTVRHERISVADDLRRALKVDEGLSLVYQPIFDTESREVVGLEALLRWERPVFGSVPPNDFVPIAEEAGLIDALTRWTLRRACDDAREWPNVRLSVNISPHQFRDPHFDSNVTAILAETGFPAGRLEMEVIESGFLVESDQARRTVEAFRTRGMTLALDDFGTGYSSIGYLRCHAFDRIKLDRSIIVGIEYDEKVNELVCAAVALAHSLDLQVTAEGVENPEEAKLLSLAGCRELQGHYLAAPVPAAEVSGLLASLRNARPLGAIA
jgi:diguanylate cyclase (GGDEF)-like protein